MDVDNPGRMWRRRGEIWGVITDVEEKREVGNAQANLGIPSGE
jgi:hypothetical protein